MASDPNTATNLGRPKKKAKLGKYKPHPPVPKGRGSGASGPPSRMPTPKGRGTSASAPPGQTVKIGSRTVNVRAAFSGARAQGRGTGASAPPGKTATVGGRTINVREAFSGAKPKGRGQTTTPPRFGVPSGESMKKVGPSLLPVSPGAFPPGLAKKALGARSARAFAPGQVDRVQRALAKRRKGKS